MCGLSSSNERVFENHDFYKNLDYFQSVKTKCKFARPSTSFL
jgi:hypothetical protein